MSLYSVIVVLLLLVTTQLILGEREYGAPEMLHHRTPAGLENPGEKSVFFRTSFSVGTGHPADKYPIIHWSPFTLRPTGRATSLLCFG